MVLFGVLPLREAYQPSTWIPSSSFLASVLNPPRYCLILTMAKVLAAVMPRPQAALDLREVDEPGA
jgi:hypothetical protein